MDAPDDLILTITDARRAGYCASGVRRWFDAHELDFRDFLKNGIRADDLLSTGDAIAERVVAARLARGT